MLRSTASYVRCRNILGSKSVLSYEFSGFTSRTMRSSSTSVNLLFPIIGLRRSSPLSMRSNSSKCIRNHSSKHGFDTIGVYPLCLHLFTKESMVAASLFSRSRSTTTHITSVSGR